MCEQQEDEMHTALRIISHNTEQVTVKHVITTNA